jgi:hypothetical protein
VPLLVHLDRVDADVLTLVFVLGDRGLEGHPSRQARPGLRYSGPARARPAESPGLTGRIGTRYWRGISTGIFSGWYSVPCMSVP